ncbi:glycoside hydrolase family 61 protein [Hysterangium stoloniferum]|nr:glycoside hydrolase family 61 protein [Hysterangium stoloniferum]
MKYASTFATLALAASLAPSALAHGFLRSITIDGKHHKGNIPRQSNNPSPIRVIDDITPVKGATNRAVNCGKNAKIAAQVVPANPGSVVAFDWASGDNTKWPHDIGPMLTYMSTCGNTTCDKFDAINAKWFKIDEAGQRPNNLREWAQHDLFEGKTVNVTLPNDLPPGDYLVRHEIIALHLGNEKGGAEFYPSCSQIRLSQPSNNTPIQQPSVTVSLPGAYSDTDPGIFVPTIFDPVKNYHFPGPPISNVVTGSNSTGSNPTSSAASGGNSSCSSVRPRKISRVMTNFRRTGFTEAISL